MNRPRRVLALAAALVVLLPTAALGDSGRAPADAPPSALQTPAAQPSIVLRMKAGTFDPAIDPFPGPAELQAPVLPAPSDLGSDGRARFILQFEAGVNPELVERLWAQGILYERYLPDGAMIVSAFPRDVPFNAEAVGARAVMALHPTLKIAPEWWSAAAQGRGPAVRAAVLVFTGPEAGPTLAHAGTLLAFDGRFAILDLASDRILSLARHADVEWIEPYAAPAPMLDTLTRTIGARQVENGAFGPATGLAVWSYNNVTRTFEGVNGSGVTINIADTGVDSTHPTFAGRIVAAFGYGDNATCDCSPGTYPHGTHVAGIAAGNGSWRVNDTDREQGKYAGVAPGASIVAQMIFNSIRTPAQYSQDAYGAGAFVNSNSWAATGGGTYTSLAEEYDALAVDANGRDAGAPQMVYVFSSGNSGRYGDTGAPSNGKNVISVGASGNNRGSSPDQVAGFSSRGPASDGRVKPDLVAPGELIDSARAEVAGCGGGEDNCSYWLASGTSMSAPAVSGAAALVTQAYRLAHGVSPSAAMVKGLLIAGAKPLPNLAWPGPEQGWGLINVSRSVDDLPGFSHLVWDEGVALAQVSGRTQWSTRVFANGGGELRFVLQWSDVPGVTSSAKALINDLDLEVRAPDGKLYMGNLFTEGHSVQGADGDRGNNTEVVRLPDAQRGAWTITVRVAAVPAGDQRFALVATGDIADRWVSLAPKSVEFSPVSPREDDPLAVIVPVFNDGTAYSGPLTVSALWEGAEGSETQYVEIVSVRPGDDFPATFTFYPKRGTHSISIAVDIAGTSQDEISNDNLASGSVFVRGFEPAARIVRPVVALAPLATETFLVEVANFGNVEDLISFAATASTGWTVALNATSGWFDTAARRLVAGTVTAPDRVLPGDDGEVRVRITSGGNASRTADAIMVVGVAGSAASRVAQEVLAITASPGETVDLPFSVENAGNVELHVNIAAAFQPAAPANFSLSPAALQVTVPPYSTFESRVRADIPRDALASAYRSVVLTISSQEEAAASELAYQIAVRRVGGFAVGGSPPAQSGLPGEMLAFPIEVRNTGNFRETFSVAATSAQSGPARVQFNVENATLVVAPFSTGYATVEAYILRLADAGPFGAVVQVTPSLGAASTVAVTGEVSAVHAVESAAPPRTVVRLGSSSSFTVTIANSGNGAEQVAFLVAELPDGLTVSGWDATSTVDPGTELGVAVRVDASPSASLGLHTLKLELRPATGTAFPAQLLEVQVDVRPAPAAPPTTPGFSSGAAAFAVAVAGAALVVARRRRRP